MLNAVLDDFQTGKRLIECASLLLKLYQKSTRNHEMNETMTNEDGAEAARRENSENSSKFADIFHEMSTSSEQKMPDKKKVKEFIKKYKDIVMKDNSDEDCKDQKEKNMQGMTTFKILLQLPQPAHLIVLMTVLYLGFVLFPKETPTKVYEPGTLSNLVYIGSFATHFGTQMWMTFVSGIVLFFTIPRNNFAQVQRILFPKYFLINTVLGLLTLTTFIQHHPDSWTLQQKIQGWALAVCFVTELGTRLYIVPPLLQLMAIRNLIEDEAGVGNEIGRHEPGKLKHCPHYAQIHRQFRKFHGFCAAANVTAVACNGIHLYHLATCLTGN